jgi:cobalt-zinc-cadmium efflux system outer membrane protein
MRIVVLCATLTAFIAPGNAGAQSLPLTESEALGRLSPESPRVRAIRAGIDVARADVLAAGRWPNPRVTVDRESVAGVTENMAMVSQALPITGRRGLEVRAASAMVDASTSRADDAMRRARADLRLAFAQLVSAQIREREFAAARGRLRELGDVLGKREAAGDAAGFDRLRAEREVLDLDADRAIAATDRARAQATLAGFFVESIDPARIVAVEASRPPAALPAVDALVDRAASTRGELLALLKEIDAARLSARAADRRRVPEPEVVGGTKSSTAAGGDMGSVITVHASLPLFDRNRPERALAEARAKQAEARADAFRLTLRTEIAALRAAVTERRETADRYRSAAVNGAGQIERIAQVSYDAGERGILELLDAYRTGASARIRQAALDAAVRQAEVELEFVSGWELPQ